MKSYIVQSEVHCVEEVDNGFSVGVFQVHADGGCHVKERFTLAQPPTNNLFEKYFKALDVTIQRFGAARSDPDQLPLAYASKTERTAILNDLMASLRAKGIHSFAEGHRLFYEGKLR